MSKSAGPKCIFHTKFLREEVDPRVQAAWPTAKVPFGDLRRTWRLVHCSTMNPYGDSELCPYRPQDCALAFLATVQYAAEIGDRNPMGLFRTAARSDALRRLDDKPLARDQVREERPSLAGAGPGDPEPRPDGDGDGGLAAAEASLHRARRRPDSVGEVLRALNLGPHPRPEPDGRREVESGQ